MRTKKIRGHKKKWAEIDAWIAANKQLDIGNLKTYQRDHTKIWVHPWSGITVTNSQIPEPKRETKRRIIKGLIAIYEGWKASLDQLNEPYYLKIWLYEPRLFKSQVVCAIEKELTFYENTFFAPPDPKEFYPAHYGALENALGEFRWDHRLDEFYLDNTELPKPEAYCYESDKKWVNNMMKKPHRTVPFSQPIGEATESYMFRRGDVWVGGK